MSHLQGPIKMSPHELWARRGQKQGIMCSGFEGLWKWLARIYSLRCMRASLEGLFTKWISLNHSTMCSHSWQKARERERVTDTGRDRKWLYNQFKLCLCIFVFLPQSILYLLKSWFEYKKCLFYLFHHRAKNNYDIIKCTWINTWV